MTVLRAAGQDRVQLIVCCKSGQGFQRPWICVRDDPSERPAMLPKIPSFLRAARVNFNLKIISNLGYSRRMLVWEPGSVLTPRDCA